MRLGWLAGLGAVLLAGVFAGTAGLAPAATVPGPAAAPVVSAARAALGAWPGAPAPARIAAGGTEGLLYSVSAAGARATWAVGAGGGNAFGPHSTPLILRWTGRAWRQAPVPRLPDASAVVSVTTLTASDAWAVGEDDAQYGGDIGRLLILHWDGRSWRQVRSPDQGSGILESVAAVSARDVWAVGQTGDGEPVIIHWTGAAWHQVRAPAGALGFMAVSADRANSVWATATTTAGRYLIARWDGTSWRKTPVPAKDGNLWGLAAPGARPGWAVGSGGAPPPFGKSGSVILRWNGSRWSAVRSPAPTDELTTVSSNSARSAWAAGASGVYTGHSKLAILRWNGVAWKLAPVPRPAGLSVLAGVAARTSRSAWAVGSVYHSNVTRTLILHWNGVRWTAVPS
jgi:hypothetical protein